MTVLAFERYPIDPVRAEEFDRLADELLGAMRAAPGVLWADAARAFDDEPSRVLLSEWRTQADVDAWEGGREARSFAEASEVLLRGEVTRRRFSGL